MTGFLRNAMTVAIACCAVAASTARAQLADFEQRADALIARMTLEQKVQQLETENAWLKGLITEKSGGKHTTSDLKALLSKHEEAAGRSSPTHTDGVGTKA